MDDGDKMTLQEILAKADEIRQAVKEYDRDIELLRSGLAALTELVKMLHDRVSRIEEHMTASEEKVLSGNLPFIGITPEQTMHLLLLNVELREEARKEATDG